jgi:hypothetical protein
MAGRTGFAGNTGGNDDKVGVVEGRGEAGFALVGGDSDGSVAMPKVSSNALGVGDVVERELANEGLHVHEQREWLPNPPCCAQHRHLEPCAARLLPRLRRRSHRLH